MSVRRHPTRFGVDPKVNFFSVSIHVHVKISWMASHLARGHRTVAIESKHLKEIREGRSGLALALYFDVDDEEWEDYYSAVSSVLALDSEASRKVLKALQDGLEHGEIQEISDDASDAVNIVLASSLSDQVLAARILDNVCGRMDDSVGRDLTPTG